MDPKFIIHYKHLKVSTKLLAVNENTHKNLKDCKYILLELGGENLHSEQCKGIPDEFDENVPLYYHRECCTKFTYAQTLKKRKAESANVDVELKRPKRTEDTYFFPKHCMFCKKNRITVKKKEMKLSKLLTVTAQ